MSTVTEPRWRRLEPDERRGQILACARRLFGARPYAEVSATEIARQAGVARGLINHYFGSKRGLYLEVMREALTIPASAVERLPRGSLDERVHAAVDWLLDMLTRHGDTWLAATGAQGLGPDPELERILAQADDESAGRVLDALGFGGEAGRRQELLAMVRSYSAMAKAAGREWLTRGSLHRAQVRSLLACALLAIVREAFPAARGERA